MQSSCVHHGRNGAATPHAWWSTQNSWHGAFQLQSCIQIVTGMRSWIRGRGVCAPATLDVKGTKRHTALCLSSPPLRESRRPGLHLDRRAADHPSSGRYVISMEPPAMKIPFSVVIPALGSNSCGLVTVRYPVCPRYLWVGLFCARNKVPITLPLRHRRRHASAIDERNASLYQWARLSFTGSGNSFSGSAGGRPAVIGVVELSRWRLHPLLWETCTMRCREIEFCRIVSRFPQPSELYSHTHRPVCAFPSRLLVRRATVVSALDYWCVTGSSLPCYGFSKLSEEDHTKLTSLQSGSITRT